MFAFSRGTTDEGNVVGAGVGLQAAAKSPSKPDQMRLVQVSVITEQTSPPIAKSAG
jgi:hypothetical protein